MAPTADPDGNVPHPSLKLTTINIIGGILCSICQVTFRNKNEYDSHYKKHNSSSEIKYTCVACHREIVGYASFRGHCYTSHVYKERFKCNICAKHFSKQSALKTHNEAMHMFKCQAPCNKEFTSKQELKLHKVIHIESGPAHLCQKCQAKISSIEICKQHLNKHVSYTYSCPICEKKFDDRSTITQHLTTHFKGETFQNVETETEVPDVNAITACGGIYCHVCNYTFKSKIEFDEHVSDHPEEDVHYSCKQCGAKYEQYSSLTSHCYNHYRRMKFTCGNCARSFSRMSDLVSHSHKCSGSHVPGLTSGDDSYCRQCGMVFGSLASCEKHLNLHRNKTLFCPVCDKIIKDSFHATTHIRTHFQGVLQICTICGKVFNTNHRFAEHMKIHSEGLKFECEVCNKKFTSPVHQQHMRTHTGERPFKCVVCEKEFVNRPNWYKHVQRMHQEKDPKTVKGHEKKKKKTERNQPKTPITKSSGAYKVVLETDNHTHEDSNENCFDSTAIKSDLDFNCENEIVSKSFEQPDSFKTEPINPGILEEVTSLVSLEPSSEAEGTERESTEPNIDTDLESIVQNINTDLESIEPSIDTDLDSFDPSILGEDLTFSDKHINILSEVFKFACEVCNKKFARPVHYQQHMRTHKGKKPFKCVVCEKEFVNRPNWYKHVQRLHQEMDLRTVEGQETEKNKAKTRKEKVSEVNKMVLETVNHTDGDSNKTCFDSTAFESDLDFNCENETDSKSFEQPSHHANKHLHVHFQNVHLICKICEKVFSRNYHLKRHMKIHSEVSKIECEVCHKMFARPVHYQKHMRKHTHKGKKPFQCVVCEKEFVNRLNWYKHVQRIHQEIDPENVKGHEKITKKTEKNKAKTPIKKLSEANEVVLETDNHTHEDSNGKCVDSTAFKSDLDFICENEIDSKSFEQPDSFKPKPINPGILKVASLASLAPSSEAEDTELESIEPSIETDPESIEPIIDTDLDSIDPSVADEDLTFSDDISRATSSSSTDKSNAAHQSSAETPNCPSEYGPDFITNILDVTSHSGDVINYPRECGPDFINDILDTTSHSGHVINYPREYGPDFIKDILDTTSHSGHVINYPREYGPDFIKDILDTTSHSGHVIKYPSEYGPEFINDTLDTTSHRGHVINLNDHILPHIDPLLTIQPQIQRTGPTDVSYELPTDRTDKWEPPIITKILQSLTCDQDISASILSLMKSDFY